MYTFHFWRTKKKIPTYFFFFALFLQKVLLISFLVSEISKHNVYILLWFFLHGFFILFSFSGKVSAFLCFFFIILFLFFKMEKKRFLYKQTMWSTWFTCRNFYFFFRFFFLLDLFTKQIATAYGWTIEWMDIWTYVCIVVMHLNFHVSFQFYFASLIENVYFDVYYANF